IVTAGPGAAKSIIMRWLCALLLTRMRLVSYDNAVYNGYAWLASATAASAGAVVRMASVPGERGCCRSLNGTGEAVYQHSRIYKEHHEQISVLAHAAGRGIIAGSR